MYSSHETGMTRRELMRQTAILAGGAVLINSVPNLLTTVASAPLTGIQAGTVEALVARRAEIAKAPIQSVALRGNTTMLSGPGGNVIVLNGRDGKIVVDSFVQNVWATLRQTLDGMGSAPVKVLINTHWHFDHADNNENFHNAGAAVLAHENTAKRLSEPHDALGMHFDPAPRAALPTRTFSTTHRMQANGESLELGHLPTAHTDTDIFIRYAKANVLHLGDVFFNGGYPFIDAGTRGNIGGMISATTKGLTLTDKETKVVPGHGPLGDQAALTRYRDMLVTARDRVQKLKQSGRALDDVVAQKPTADLDATWGKGFVQPDMFVALVYNTL